jgi:hypothetical protein
LILPVLILKTNFLMAEEGSISAVNLLQEVYVLYVIFSLPQSYFFYKAHSILPF